MPDPRIFPWEVENADTVVVGAVSTLILPENSHRSGLDLTNLTNPSEAISLGLGQAAVNAEGKVMTTYGSTYHMGTGNLFLGAVYAICPSGQMNMAVSEETRE